MYPGRAVSSHICLSQLLHYDRLTCPTQTLPLPSRFDPIAQPHSAFVTFLTAGYPSRESTVPAMLAMERGGADVIELGVPFSDPIADGPAIQEANTVSTGRDQVEERGNGKRRLISRSSSFFFCLLVLQSTVPNCYSAWIAPRPASPDLDPNVNLPQPSTTNAPPPQPTAANPPGRPPKQRDLRRLPRFRQGRPKTRPPSPRPLDGLLQPFIVPRRGRGTGRQGCQDCRGERVHCGRSASRGGHPIQGGLYWRGVSLGRRACRKVAEWEWLIFTVRTRVQSVVRASGSTFDEHRPSQVLGRDR